MPPVIDTTMRRLWLDLGDLDMFAHPDSGHDLWQDHGLGILRTYLKIAGIQNDLKSTRAMRSWEEIAAAVRGYDMLLMNVRSYTFPFALRAATLFKQANPNGKVVVGGMHATVALKEMLNEPVFDHICAGSGELVIVDLVRDPTGFPRLVKGPSAKSLADWPMLDRTQWPNPNQANFPWPLEPTCGWGPAPVATVITSRVCPWQCAFCNESSYIPMMGRKPVDMLIAELNYLDDHYGPIGSVVMHDSMFFQQPEWLKEFLEKYPRDTNKPWGYWAAGRADTVRQWPDLYEALIRETNWNFISLGFESGSDRVLKILNKECTAEDNIFAIDLTNQIGDDMEAKGQQAPKFFANVMVGVPGETREDAFASIRMLNRMKRVEPSISYYAPYPGSILGEQIIAEGKSLMSKDNYHRYPNDEKVKGVDYKFYDRLLKGRYDKVIAKGSFDESKALKNLSERLIKA